MHNLTLTRIQNDCTDFDVLRNPIYGQTYKELLGFFKGVTTFEYKHLYLFPQLIYGSMPTMVKIDLTHKDKLLDIFKKARNEPVLSNQEIAIVKDYINNSLVGTSKLLHFLNPRVYAIWDSRIYRYISGRKTSYDIGNIDRYLKYLEKVKDISTSKGYAEVHKKIARHFDYDIQPSRVLEIIMFQTDKNVQR